MQHWSLCSLHHNSHVRFLSPIWVCFIMKMFSLSISSHSKAAFRQIFYFQLKTMLSLKINFALQRFTSFLKKGMVKLLRPTKAFPKHSWMLFTFVHSVTSITMIFADWDERKEKVYLSAFERSSLSACCFCLVLLEPDHFRLVVSQVLFVLLLKPEFVNMQLIETFIFCHFLNVVS